MRSFLLSLFSLLLGCYLLAACSSSTDSADAVRIRWSSAPNTLDPLEVSKPQELEVFNLLHCSLLIGEPRSQQIMPWLAQSMPTVGQRGALTLLTYQLRPEATWDNGQPVLARDVAFTLRVLNCPSLPTEFARALYGFVLDIELDATDPRRFTLVCASSSSETIFASGDYSILPEYALDPTGTLRAVPLALLRTDTASALLRYPALRAFATRYRQAQLERHPERLPGCGPYQLAAWESNRYLTLQRKSHWWADRLRQPPTWLQAHARRLNYQIVPDNTTALLALRRGNLDVYPMPSPRDFNRLRQSADTSQLAFYTADSYEMITAGFNTQNLLLRDHLTRQALRHLFDIPGLIQATHAGLAYPSVSVISPQDTPAYNDSLTIPSFSPSKTKQLLQEAGWQKRTDNNWWRGETGPLVLSISYRAEIPEHETVALQFRAAAASIGIPVRLRPLEAGLLQQQLAAGNIDLYIHTTAGNPFGYNFTPMLHSQGIGLYNYTRFSSPAADRLIEAIANERNPQQQVLLLRRFQRLLQRESPLVVLYFTRNRLIASRRLRSVQAISIRPGYDVLSLQLPAARP